MFRELRLPLVLLFLGVTVSCNNRPEQTQEDTTNPPDSVSTEITVPEPDAETGMLLAYLREQGDYVNSRNFPSLIKASIVHEEMATKNYLVLDIRSPEAFSQGHIPGARQVSFSEIPEYFATSIRPFEYDRIVLVSDFGQTSAYAVCLLRLMGYGNVYSLRWGMSGWNREYAEKGWLAGCSDAYDDKLDTEVHRKPNPSGFPGLHTGKETGEEILLDRVNTLFKENPDQVMMNAAEMFQHPEAYFIINYDRRDKYEAGHIPQAVRYKPGATLGFEREMATIPSERPVAVYCGTGHNSAFVTAYLRLFGYDAHTLKFGNNGFMYGKMVKERTTLSWLPFTLAVAEDFEVEK